MNISANLKRPKALLAITLSAAALVFVAGCDSPKADVQLVAPAPAPVSTSVGTKIDDSVVTAKVKSALFADPDVMSNDLKVETRNGEVMLSGFVNNATQMDRALLVARGVQGVTDVTNKMTLKEGAATVGNDVDDTIITAKIKSALLADPNIKSFDIAVVTRKGEAQLSGFVDNQTQIDHASELTRAVEGVKLVTNEMSIKK